MSQFPRRNSVLVGRNCGLYRMHYREWGDAGNQSVVVCVHGLTRNGRDFTALAERLSASYRVIAPDVVGRGDSDCLRDPMGYLLPLYTSDMLVLLARLQVEEIDWVGVSMGGLIGILLANFLGHRLKRLVLSDIGPVIDQSAVARIVEYAGKKQIFPSHTEAKAYLRTINAPFGEHTEDQWDFFTETCFQQQNGSWVSNYDPNIAAPFKLQANAQTEVSEVSKKIPGIPYFDHGINPPAVDDGRTMDGLWSYYDCVVSKTLLLRGEVSDVLSANVAQAMTQRGPKAHLVEFSKIGHAPMFARDDQIAEAIKFLHE